MAYELQESLCIVHLTGLRSPKELAIGAIVTVAFLFGGELVAAGIGLLTYLVNLFAQTAR